MVRYWDKAGTAGGGAYTAGVLLAVHKNGTFYAADVVRGQWSALERERVIRATADLDRQHLGRSVKIYLEQEPGSGGKESIEASLRNLAGFAAYGDRPTGNKDARLEPFAAQVEAGNVALKRGAWNRAFIDELCAVPTGQYRDQADAAAGAFNKLAKGSRRAGRSDYR
jgi:predicted phage terminase large subunit-like protein